MDARAVLREHFDSVDLDHNNHLDIFEFFSMLEKPEVLPSNEKHNRRAIR